MTRYYVHHQGQTIRRNSSRTFTHAVVVERDLDDQYRFGATWHGSQAAAEKAARRRRKDYGVVAASVLPVTTGA